MTKTVAARPLPAAASFSAEALRRLFLHQDGFAVAAALGSLDAVGAIEPLRRGVEVADVLAGRSAPGAVAAGLRALQSAGVITVTSSGGRPVASLEGRYAVVVDLLIDVVADLETQLAAADWGQDASVLEAVARATPTLRRVRAALAADSSVGKPERDLVTRYAEGVLATPFLPRLRHVDTTELSAVCDELLDELELGSFARPSRIADALLPFQQVYGLMGSYAQPALATRRWLARATQVPTHEVTTRIDRRLNVLASGNAHKTYFAAAQALVRRVFDDTPVAGQPRAIVDVGCGDGTWLRALSALVDRTSRGRVRDRHPLLLIGVDVDQRALTIAADRCQDLPAVFLLGDIGRPDQILQDVAATTGLDADDLLHVRAFVDHNRSIAVSSDNAETVELGATVSVDAEGSLVADHAIRDDWVRHYSRWREHTGRHGILVIEGHTLPSDELVRRRGGAHALAFEYYHGLSGQSPMSYTAFQDAVRAAGLGPVIAPQTFQRGETPTTSVQLLVPMSGG